MAAEETAPESFLTDEKYSDFRIAIKPNHKILFLLANSFNPIFGRPGVARGFLLDAIVIDALTN